jgi:hypothetical protein
MKRELLRHEITAVDFPQLIHDQLCFLGALKYIFPETYEENLKNVMPKLHNNESLVHFWHFSGEKRGKSAPPMQLLPSVIKHVASA